jgi:outer membrane protein assembly factor BamD
MTQHFEYSELTETYVFLFPNLYYICAPMKKNILLSCFAVLFVLGFSSCKSEFERVRASNDPDLLYKKGFEYYDAGDYLKAQALFELIVGGLRGKVEAEKVYYYYAYTHYKLKKYILASYYFKNFSNTFPNSEHREEADFMSAYANYQMSPSFRLDQTYSLQAIEDFQLFTNTHPRSSRVAEANKIIDEIRAKLEVKDYQQATLYFNLREYESATHCFENMLKDYPDTKDDEQIRFMIVKASQLLAQNSIYSKKAERYQATLKAIMNFESRYPKSGYGKDVRDIKKDVEKNLKSLS